MEKPSSIWMAKLGALKWPVQTANAKSSRGPQVLECWGESLCPSMRFPSFPPFSHQLISLPFSLNHFLYNIKWPMAHFERRHCAQKQQKAHEKLLRDKCRCGRRSYFFFLPADDWITAGHCVLMARPLFVELAIEQGKGEGERISSCAIPHLQGRQFAVPCPKNYFCLMPQF